MLSGIGPGAHLQQIGITPLVDLPGVGQNLNEHPDFVLKYTCLKPVSIWPQTRPIGKLLAGVNWLLRRRGICASNLFDAVGCIRSGPGVDYPDLQLTTSPVAVDDATWTPLPFHGFQIHVGLMRAHSRGAVTLRSSDPTAAPKIMVNYLSDPRDRALMRQGIRLVRELVAQPAYAGLCGNEIFPGAAKVSDADLDEMLNTHVNTQWHLSGTARMGSATDHGAVVDPTGRVHGVRGLRVVDASIMPVVTNGNTNAPTLMIAEKLSDAILGKPPLARQDIEVWQHPNYQNSQR